MKWLKSRVLNANAYSKRVRLFDFNANESFRIRVPRVFECICLNA